MQIESGRATHKEIVAEVQNRMRLLKMNQRMFKHFQAGELFCSDIWEVFPLQEEFNPCWKKYPKMQTVGFALCRIILYIGNPRKREGCSIFYTFRWIRTTGHGAATKSVLWKFPV